ncbi:helix-turn-helix domain-containing protein [Tritonibacter sp. SIMBA_163]|uniref:helix-turn-helix domain-containing protein n=1 Tax=Tritonibacter sp. SIMBA_163 TaxID=3080868 RepID=UPI0039811215
MNLSEYLNKTGITQSEFAARVGVTQGVISRLSTGHKQPGLALAIRIEFATNGAVKPHIWVQPCMADTDKGTAA